MIVGGGTSETAYAFLAFSIFYCLNAHRGGWRALEKTCQVDWLTVCTLRVAKSTYESTLLWPGPGLMFNRV